MTKSEQQTPGSPTSSGHHSDHHSDLTDSSEDDENFIALLQYKNAHHILGLSPHESSDPIPPESIQTAYDSAKKQVLTALNHCKASEKQVNGRMSVVSQHNYLELKLQALDQAYGELMPMEIMEALRKENNKSAHLEEGLRDTTDASFNKSPEKEAPSVETRQFFWNDASTNAAVRSVRTEDPSNSHKIMSSRQHRRIPSDDELDTIDIYFRPSPGHSKSSDTRQAKSLDNSSDVSSCTWDGSSIFSIVSKTKQNIEEASAGGLSDVLGPIYNSSQGRSERTRQQGTKIPTTNQSEERRNQHLRRPPPGIKVKQGSPKAQISPKSVIDFPSIHNDNHYDNIPNVSTGKAVVGRSKTTKGSRHPAANHHNSHEATEAARMGILRALSEENSECLPLDEDNHHNYLDISNGTNADPERAIRNKIPTNGRGSKQRRFFQGKSDKMPKETNSLMASVLNEQQVHARASHEQNTAIPNRSRVESSKSLSSSTSSRRQRSNAKMTTSMPSTNSYDGLLQSGEYSYGAILQSGMEFADELCVALNSCWNGDIDYPATTAVAFDAEASEPNDMRLREEESTLCTRSTIDDSTYLTQSVVTDGESTTFNTMSSFSRRADSPNLNSNRKISSSPVTTTSSDPPPRMLV